MDHPPHVIPAPQKRVPDLMRKTIIPSQPPKNDPSQIFQLCESDPIEIAPYESWRIVIEITGRIASYRIQCNDELGGISHYMTSGNTFYIANQQAVKRVIRIVYLVMM